MTKGVTTHCDFHLDPNTEEHKWWPGAQGRAHSPSPERLRLQPIRRSKETEGPATFKQSQPHPLTPSRPLGSLGRVVCYIMGPRVTVRPEGLWRETAGSEMSAVFMLQPRNCILMLFFSLLNESSPLSDDKLSNCPERGPVLGTSL